MPVPSTMKGMSDFNYGHDDHQYSERYDAPNSRCYDLKQQEHDHQFHSELPPSRVWSFNGVFGGPVLDAKWGDAFCFRLKNELDPNHRGYGDPGTTSHLHNMHTATESDGGPWNWLNPGTRGPSITAWRAPASPIGRRPTPTRGHPAAAGGRQNGGGDLRETLTTLFMHDHMPDFTAPNLYKGLFMMFRMFDEMDTGNESTGWKLPSGNYDVPLLFQDKEIVGDTGEMTYNQFAIDGFIGPYLTVNGDYKPYFEVEPRAYRFRLLNGGPSRFYRCVFRKDGQYVPFADHGAQRQLPAEAQEEPDEHRFLGCRAQRHLAGLQLLSRWHRNHHEQHARMRDDGRGEQVGSGPQP